MVLQQKPNPEHTPLQTVIEFGFNIPSILTPYQRVVKRLNDLVLCTLFLLFSLPVMLVIAILLRLESSEAILKRHQRIGEKGKLFTLYAFRTSVMSIIPRYSDDGQVEYRRPSRVGHFLKQTHLDELPVLFNLLKGDMTLVGPRPESPRAISGYEPWQRQRFSVPPGLICWWHDDEQTARPIPYNPVNDLYYVQNYSLRLDFMILWKTVPLLFKRPGAF